MTTDEIKSALRNFKNAPLRKGGMELLKAFGLESERTNLTEGYVDGSLHDFFNRCPEWRQALHGGEIFRLSRLIQKIFPLFQITEEEVDLPPADGEDGGMVAFSIIFVVADMRCASEPTQDEFSFVIHMLNKGFGHPVVGLFRYKSKIACAAMAHRKNKVDPEKDVLFNGGATMGIHLHEPQWRHQDFLLRWWEIINLNKTSNLATIVMHLADVPNEYRAYLLCERSSAPDIMRDYVQEMSRWPLLSKAQEQELGKNMTPAKREELICSNLRLVVWVAKKFTWQSRLDILDIIQAGNIGLMKAVERYNYQLGYKFSTYAFYWIRQSITRTIRNDARSIRVPVHRFDDVFKLNRAARQIFGTTGCEASDQTLAEKLKWSKGKVKKLKKVATNFLSDEISIDGNVPLAQLNSYIDENTPTPAEIAINDGMKYAVREALNSLTKRESDIMRLRFGIGMRKGYSLQAIGDMFDLTRERIRQIESKALKKLRSSNRAMQLHDFLRTDG